MCFSFLRPVAFTILEHVFVLTRRCQCSKVPRSALVQMHQQQVMKFDCCKQGSALQSTCSPKRNRGKSLSSARLRTGSGLVGGLIFYRHALSISRSVLPILPCF